MQWFNFPQNKTVMFLKMRCGTSTCSGDILVNPETWSTSPCSICHKDPGKSIEKNMDISIFLFVYNISSCLRF